MENSFDCKKDLSFYLTTSQLWQFNGQRAPGAFSAFWHLNPCSCFIQWLVLLGFFPSPLAPYNDLQKCQSTEKRLPKPPLTNHFLHALLFPNLCLWLHQITSILCGNLNYATHPKWIKQRINELRWIEPMPGGGKALSVAPQAFWYSFLLGFTASLDKPLGFFEGEKTLRFLS